MARTGTIAPLAKEALANGVSADDLVKQHPELDEKALRRGYAQAKSKAGKAAKPGTAKGKKKTAKKLARPRVAPAAPAPVAAAPAVGNTSNADLRKLILQHGTRAVRAALVDVES